MITGAVITGRSATPHSLPPAVRVHCTHRGSMTCTAATLLVGNEATLHEGVVLVVDDKGAGVYVGNAGGMKARQRASVSYPQRG